MAPALCGNILLMTTATKTPVKSKAVRGIGRKVTVRTPKKTSHEFELTAPAAAPEKPKKAGSRLASAFSLYPDLHLAIAMLGKRQTQLEGNKAELVGRWVTDLTRIQAEITKLKKLEGLTESVKRPTSDE